MPPYKLKVLIQILYKIYRYEIVHKEMAM